MVIGNAKQLENFKYDLEIFNKKNKDTNYAKRLEDATNTFISLEGPADGPALIDEFSYHIYQKTLEVFMYVSYKEIESNRRLSDDNYRFAIEKGEKGFKYQIPKTKRYQKQKIKSR